MKLRGYKNLLNSDPDSPGEAASTGEKRREHMTGRACVPAKRARRDATYGRSLIEQLTPDSCSTGTSTLRTYGPYLHGQFQDKSLPLVQLEEVKLVDAMAHILGNTCKSNEMRDRAHPSILSGGPPYRSKKYSDGSSSIFYSLSKPSIVLRNYLTRFIRYLNVSRSVFIVGLIYLDRISDEDELLGIRELNIHRLITSSFCVAAKYLEDESHRNASLARIGGVPTTEEMNLLEAQFLKRLRWDCSVPIDVYEVYEDSIIKTSISFSRSRGTERKAGLRDVVSDVF